MNDIEALLTTLKIYGGTNDEVSQGFYQGLCMKAKESIEQLQAELEKHRWIPVSERLPEYVGGLNVSLNMSKNILILDNKQVSVGNYQDEKFVYWSGSWCNTDEPNSQKAITHWKPIILPEQALKGR